MRIHSLTVCLTTGPKPLPKPALHIVRSRSFSFKWEYPLLSLRSFSSFLRLLPCLSVTSQSFSSLSNDSPKLLPKRALHIVRSRAFSFKWEYSLLSLRSLNSFLRFLPRLSVTSQSFSSLSYDSPKTLPKRALHIVRSRAFSFKWEYPLLSLRSSSIFLRLLPCLSVTSIPLCIFPSVTRCRMHFLRKMSPIQFAFRLRISYRILRRNLKRTYLIV
jgi:hypothetical protein